MQSTDLMTDHPMVRSVSSMPPLLRRLSERKPEALDYIGVSYGLTPQLLRYAYLIVTTLFQTSHMQVLEESGICAALLASDY